MSEPAQPVPASTDRPDRPLQRPGLRLERAESVTVVFDAEGLRLCTLNETALALWGLCDGTTAPAEMVEAVSLVCNVPRSQAAADVERTMDELTDAGLLVRPADAS